MTTALLSALAQEQHGLVALLTETRVVRRAGRDFTLGTLHGHAVVLALSRIGKVAAATTATTLIEAFGVQRIVFTGVAGSLSPDVHVGDLVVASAFVQHDMDASPLFARFEIPLYGRTRFACDEGLTACLFQASRDALAQWPDEQTGTSVHQGLVASGDRFLATSTDSHAVRATLQAAGMHALAVEMEGAAVAQVCHDYGMPFAAVRTISDSADEQAPMNFQQFVNRVAGRYSCSVVSQLMRAL
ncbi:MAG: 5'-methylthioadenosine/adenosylhomocysteine nucleosidase [Burkholderiaceae bacterium]